MLQGKISILNCERRKNVTASKENREKIISIDYILEQQQRNLLIALSRSRFTFPSMETSNLVLCVLSGISGCVSEMLQVCDHIVANIKEEGNTSLWRKETLFQVFIQFREIRKSMPCIGLSNNESECLPPIHQGSR